MDTRFILHITAVLLISFLLFGCVPKACQEFEDRAWAFELPVSLTPARDTFQIGDTIFIESRFVNRIRDSVSGEFILLDDYDFYPNIGISKVDENLDVSPLILNRLLTSDVEYDIVHHSTGSDASIVIDSYNYDGEYYEYSFSFRFETSGTYTFLFDSGLSLLPAWVPNDNPDVDHNCSRHRGDITAFYLMNGGNVIENNIEMFRSSNAINATTRKTYEYRHFGYYTFVVAE